MLEEELVFKITLIDVRIDGINKLFDDIVRRHMLWGNWIDLLGGRGEPAPTVKSH